MELASQLVIDYADNPKLREILYGLDPGDELVLKRVVAIINEKTDQIVRASISSIAIPGEAPVKPNRMEPVMVRMMGKAGERPRETEPHPAEEPDETPGTRKKMTAVIPKGVLEGNTVRVGDKVEVEVIRVGQDSIEIRLSGNAGTGGPRPDDKEAQQVMTAEPVPSYA